MTSSCSRSSLTWTRRGRSAACGRQRATYAPPCMSCCVCSARQPACQCVRLPCSTFKISSHLTLTFVNVIACDCLEVGRSVEGCASRCWLYLCSVVRVDSRALCDFLVACWLCIVFAVSRAFNEAVLPPEFADIDSGRHKGHVQRLRHAQLLCSLHLLLSIVVASGPVLGGRLLSTWAGRLVRAFPGHSRRSRGRR